MPGERTCILNVRTTSESITENFGENLGIKIDSGVCISLVGTLGSGKTVLARGLCRGLGVHEVVLSPTFILYEEFEGRLPVVHIDLYRLEHDTEIEELGVFEKLGENCVVIAEWGDRSEMVYENSDIVIKLRSKAETEREISVECTAEAREFFR